MIRILVLDRDHKFVSFVHVGTLKESVAFLENLPDDLSAVLAFR